MYTFPADLGTLNHIIRETTDSATAKQRLRGCLEASAQLRRSLFNPTTSKCNQAKTLTGRHGALRLLYGAFVACMVLARLKCAK